MKYRVPVFVSFLGLLQFFNSGIHDGIEEDLLFVHSLVSLDNGSTLLLDLPVIDPVVGFGKVKKNFPTGIIFKDVLILIITLS